jgi:hypothetical protein
LQPDSANQQWFAVFGFKGSGSSGPFCVSGPDSAATAIQPANRHQPSRSTIAKRRSHDRAAARNFVKCAVNATQSQEKCLPQVVSSAAAAARYMIILLIFSFP